MIRLAAVRQTNLPLTATLFAVVSACSNCTHSSRYTKLLIYTFISSAILPSVSVRESNYWRSFHFWTSELFWRCNPATRLQKILYDSNEESISNLESGSVRKNICPPVQTSLYSAGSFPPTIVPNLLAWKSISKVEELLTASVKRQTLPPESVWLGNNRVVAAPSFFHSLILFSIKSASVFFLLFLKLFIPGGEISEANRGVLRESCEQFGSAFLQYRFRDSMTVSRHEFPPLAPRNNNRFNFRFWSIKSLKIFPGKVAIWNRCSKKEKSSRISDGRFYHWAAYIPQVFQTSAWIWRSNAAFLCSGENGRLCIFSVAWSALVLIESVEFGGWKKERKNKTSKSARS